MPEYTYTSRIFSMLNLWGLGTRVKRSKQTVEANGRELDDASMCVVSVPKRLGGHAFRGPFDLMKYIRSNSGMVACWGQAAVRES